MKRSSIFSLKIDKFLKSCRFFSISENPGLFLLITLLLSGCSSVSNKQNINPGEENLIQLSKAQFESNRMQIAEVTDQYFSEEVKCNGYITAPVNGSAQISTPIPGVIEAIYFSLNDYIRKGQVICQLSGNEFMTLQHDFAETSARLIKLTSDYERIKTLYNEDIGAKKEYISAESDYKVMQAKYQIIKMRLEHLSLDVSKIEKGIFYDTFPVVSPINGYITSHNISLGQYTDPQKILAEIVDTYQLQLQLSVFENDISKLKTGQVVNFKSSKDTESVHEATITSIGRAVNPDTKTIKCIARINPEKGNAFINQTYIEAVVKVSNRQAKALPNDAIIKSGKEFLVLAVDKQDNSGYFLRKVKVDIGNISNQYTEIFYNTPGLRVISKGAYFINAE
jgi:membrane fusion protein, heavy metal efflux system